MSDLEQSKYQVRSLCRFFVTLLVLRRSYLRILLAARRVASVDLRPKCQRVGQARQVGRQQQALLPRNFPLDAFLSFELWADSDPFLLSRTSDVRTAVHRYNHGKWPTDPHPLLLPGLIQVPRLYDIYKGQGLVNNFQDIIRSASSSPLLSLAVVSDPSLGCLLDLFQPLFEVTQDPSSHPELHIFLQRVIGFDSCVHHT